MHFLVVENFDFPRKNVKFCQNRIFGQKFDFSNSVIKMTYLKMIFVEI